MHKTLIASHILPQEIDQFYRQLHQFKKSVEYLSGEDYIEFYCVMNVSPGLFDWTGKESLKKEFIDRFLEAEKLCDWQNKVKFQIIRNNEMLGCVDYRRFVTHQFDKSITDFIFLDSDIWFHDTLLAYLLESAKEIQNQYYVLTPQTVKLWDHTWDVLVHKDFANEKYGFERKFDPKNVLTQDVSESGLIEAPVFKFAGGWFNLYSANLWRYIGVPEELGCYGSEDTFVMIAAEIMKLKRYDVQQYILSGQYICEDYQYQNPYKDKLTFSGNKQAWLDAANRALAPLLTKFQNELKVNA